MRKNEDRINNLKGKILQAFCRHEPQNCIKRSVNGPDFYNLRGDTVYVVCRKCGKVLDTIFYPNWDE